MALTGGWCRQVPRPIYIRILVWYRGLLGLIEACSSVGGHLNTGLAPVDCGLDEVHTAAVLVLNGEAEEGVHHTILHEMGLKAKV